MEDTNNITPVASLHFVNAKSGDSVPCINVFRQKDGTLYAEISTAWGKKVEIVLGNADGYYPSRE